MRVRNREIQVFSMSFLDVLSCALGGVLLLLFMMSPPSMPPIEPLPAPPEPVAPELPTPEPEEGLIIPIVFAVRIDWDEPVDVDLWVKEPGGSFVSYNKRQGTSGFLMRDALAGTEHRWEIYCTIAPQPGIYEIYAHVYSEVQQPVNAELSVQVYPGDARWRQRFETSAVLRRHEDPR